MVFRFGAVLFFFVVVVFFLLVIFGCDGDDDGGDLADEMVLYHTLPGKIKGLDPCRADDVYSAVVSGNIFEGLYQYHFLKRPYEVVPLLADGAAEVSSGGLVVTIRIKRGVYFQDDRCFAGGVGRELVAGDFVYSFKRIADVGNLSPNWGLLDERIVGLDAFREYSRGCDDGAAVDY